MKKLIILITVLSSFLLVGCNDKTYTVAEFLKDGNLRNEYSAKCRNGEINGDSLNCQNVFKAKLRLNRPTNTGSWN